MTTRVASAGSTRSHEVIRAESWPSEYPLFIVAVLCSILAWLVLAISIIGLIYVGMFALFFAVMHLAFVVHVRGSGVRLGSDQFPKLYSRVEELARRMEMDRVPEVYLMQAGGTLNAFATKFLRRHMVVLFSDLLDACGDNEAARDMIIGHELAHIRCGHLKWRWLLLPASIVPFLGTALSRAREYTCGRFGYASAGDHDGALLGLTILAAGGRYAPAVDRAALVRQRQDLNTGFMTLGTWLSTHPPLAKRLHALDPSLGDGQHVSNAGAWRAIGILGLLPVPFILVGALAATVFKDQFAQFSQQLQAAGAGSEYATGFDGDLPPLPEHPERMLEQAVAALSTLLNAELAAGRELPNDLSGLIGLWESRNPGVEMPRDPYDGQYLGYVRVDDGYILYSSGPDRMIDTDDDLEFSFPR